MKLTFGVSTWLWTSPFHTETISLFPKIKEMGFDFVEIPIEDPDIIDAEKVKAALDQYGLSAVACGAFGPERDLTHQDPRVHQTCFDYIEKCFALGKIWGAEFLAGPMYSAVGKTRLLPAEERKREWDLAVTNLREVCDLAAKWDMDIALEPLNRFESDLVNTAEDVVRMIEDINHPSAKILLDGFHMTIEERDLEQAIRLAGDKLIHVQVSENHRGTPGTGQTNWTAMKNGLKAIGYNGPISIESFTTEVQELAGAVCIWKPLAPSQDGFAKDGLAFLKGCFGNGSL